MGDLLKNALADDNLILSNVGPHAGEGWQRIVTRKSDDIRKIGHTVWLLNSNAARPDAIQAFCSSQNAQHVIFVARTRDAAEGPSTGHKARSYSVNGKAWQTMPNGLGDVTGNINKATTGLWLAALEKVETGNLNLEGFSKHPSGPALDRFWPSDSTYLVRRIEPVSAGRYEILAVGRLATPFAVWLKK